VTLGTIERDADAPSPYRQIAAHLREAIRRGELAPGDKLPSETELMAQLGVGRTTVREAVRVLAHAGMLDVRQGDGTYVTSSVPTLPELANRLRQAHVLEVFAVRRALELEMVRLAALERSERQLRTLRQIVKRMAKILDRTDPDRTAYAAESIELHMTVARATGNDVFEELYASFAVALQQAFDEVNAIPGVMERSLAQQEALVDCIAAHDADAAYVVTREHLDRITAHLGDLIATAVAVPR
jgi:GntR family transcriptional regulator, transcriptional repressor for pyruvate dehydrogenase complex